MPKFKISNDYISKCIECLKRTGADNEGGPTNAKGKTECQQCDHRPA